MTYLGNNGHERYKKLMKHCFQATNLFGKIYSTEAINHLFLTRSNELAKQLYRQNITYLNSYGNSSPDEVSGSHIRLFIRIKADKNYKL